MLLKLLSVTLIDISASGAFILSLVPPLAGVPSAAVYLSRLSGRKVNGWYGLFNLIWVGFIGPIICYLIGKKLYLKSKEVAYKLNWIDWFVLIVACLDLFSMLLGMFVVLF